MYHIDDWILLELNVILKKMIWNYMRTKITSGEHINLIFTLEIEWGLLVVL